MAKVRKKPSKGTPGGNFPDTHRTDTVTLSVIKEKETTENTEETLENDHEQESQKGDYEEKLKVEVLVTKTQNPVHVRTQAILVLSRLLDSDHSRKILPFLAHHRSGYKALTTSDDLPQKEADLLVYLANPTLKNASKTTTQQRLSFFVRTCSNMTLQATKQADGNLEWLKSHNTYIELMEIDTTDNERIGMLIGKAPRITSLPALYSTINAKISQTMTDDHNQDIPPFQLNFDNIGNATDKTRTRVVTFTCSKVHSRLLMALLQATFPPNTNHPFLSFTVLYSLPKETQITILSQHQQRTTGKTMLDVTIPKFHGLSTKVMINNKLTTLRESLGNIRHLDGSLLHLDIDDATRNEDTIMIVSPNDMSRAKQVIGLWIQKHTNQTVNWQQASSFSSDTYRLDLSSRNSAEGFASAFPTMITLPTPLGNAQTPAPVPSVARKPQPSNAWKTLSYSDLETPTTKATPTTDNATTKTDISSTASNTTVILDSADTTISRDRLNNTNDRLSLREARQTIENIAQQKFMSFATLRVADLETRLSRLESAGDAQDKINKSTLLTLVTAADDENKDIITTDLSQRINSKIRTRKLEKQNQSSDNFDLKQQMKLPADLIHLSTRAIQHVKRLKARLERHMTFCMDDDDDSSSSISTLGLDHYDNLDYDLDSDNETESVFAPKPDIANSQQKPLPTTKTDERTTHNTTPKVAITKKISLPPKIEYPYDTSIDTVMQTEHNADPSLVTNTDTPEDTHTDMMDFSTASELYEQLASLKRAATAPPTPQENNSTPDKAIWETPPPEILQEWKVTKSKSRISKPTMMVIRGPLGRLSPPNAPRLPTPNNRYAILQNLPLTRPPVQSSQPKTSLQHTHSNQTSRLRAHGNPIQSLSKSTPPDSPPTTNSAILAFFESKRAKKGSPTKKKAKKRHQSSSSDDMSTDTKENEWTWPNDPPPSLPPPPVTRSHRHLLLPSENFDSDTDSFETRENHNMTQEHNNPVFSDHYPEELSHSTTPISNNHDNPQSFHNSQGTEYNTVYLYTDPSVFHDNEMNEEHEENSETPTILASDDESIILHDTDQTHHEENSCIPPIHPSDSIQYKSPNAGLEGDEG